MTREEEIINAANELCNSFRGGKTYKLGFEIGVKWADEHPKSPWISVEDGLPYNNPNNIHFGFTNKVLVMDDNKNVFIAFMKKYKDGKWFWCRDDNFNLSYIITHWMPIPEPPKE